MQTTDAISTLNQNYRTLLSQQKTLCIATASLSGQPDISYAPFVRDQQGVFYIYISELAQHTQNLLLNPQASLLFIGAESNSANLFARERVLLNCSAHEIARTEALYNEQLQALQAMFGQVVQLLASLNDFHLFALRIENGRYIAGFGKAYTIDVGNNTLAELIHGK